MAEARPAQRARLVVYLVHILRFEWDEVARTLGTSPEAARELYAGALRRLNTGRDDGPEQAASMAKLPPKRPSPIGHHAQQEVEGEEGASEHWIRMFVAGREGEHGGGRRLRRRMG
jgi:hypothetical protein